MAVAGRRTVVRDVCRGRAAEHDCSLDKSARSNGLPRGVRGSARHVAGRMESLLKLIYGHCVTLLAVETHVPALPGRAARLRTRAPGGRTYRSFHKREPSGLAAVRLLVLTELPVRLLLCKQGFGSRQL